MKQKRRAAKLTGCPRCGCDRTKKVSGFTLCANCDHRYGEGGLGRQTEKRNFHNGEWNNVSDHRYGVTRLPDADSQNHAPNYNPRNRTELK
jgi:uncharacterized Zn finger protein (UPF0148 family)